jgi:hypothetical protein
MQDEREEASAATPAAADAGAQALQPPARYAAVSLPESTSIACMASPNIRLRLDIGIAVREGARRRYPQQTIFIDGAFSGPPFMDHAKRQYSIDHHAGCVRMFTLARGRSW